MMISYRIAIIGKLNNEDDDSNKNVYKKLN